MTGIAAAAVRTPPPDDRIQALLVDQIDVQHKSVGMVIGVITPGGRRIVSHGATSRRDGRPVDGDTAFEIASVTKAFTSLLLADMVQRGVGARGGPNTGGGPRPGRGPDRAPPLGAPASGGGVFSPRKHSPHPAGPLWGGGPHATAGGAGGDGADGAADPTADARHDAAA